jgi:hypothetical protein
MRYRIHTEEKEKVEVLARRALLRQLTRMRRPPQ